ncbi:MAG: hypothetical protein J6J42_12860 [Lachnospiraceae bacterium]|nr:hypothetical protein [Lachnospiraceae bacterium]
MVTDKTKPVSRIAVSEKWITDWVREERSKKIQEINQHLKQFAEEFYNETEKMFVKLYNKPMYYAEKVGTNYLIPDVKIVRLKNREMIDSLFGYHCRPFTVEEAEYFFTKNWKKNPLIINKEDIVLPALTEEGEIAYSFVACIGSGGEEKCIRLGQGVINWCFHDSDTCKLPVVELQSDNFFRLERFLKNKLTPVFNTSKNIEIHEELIRLYENGFLAFVSKLPVLSDAAMKAIYNGELDSLLHIAITSEKDIECKAKELTGENKKILQEDFLQCDFTRAEIEPYPEKILEDINAGHWELWEEEPVKNSNSQNNNNNNDKSGNGNRQTNTAEQAGKHYITVNPSLVARNPLADVREDGIVGIDFGTKSTIVVYQNGSDTILPMRVGSGRYKKALRQEDFENPTVMEFRDIESFLKDYTQKEGRPQTKWSDITVSHKAAEQLKNGNDSSQYYSFFSDLKQWSGDRTRKIRVKDTKGKERLLPAFVDMDGTEFNPLEIYAYYLGLFINNMYNGIYLNYILSFPVTYEKEIREKIVAGFEKGIKKSLPQAVLNDKETMEKFRIVQGASEPAAYAICALQEYGFDPEEGEKVFYGIFDFGGGTTDFDFGIWRAAEGAECRRYDNVIEHFGAGGDRYLGGENLLELLAFQVFKNNKDKLLKSDIEFYKPAECKEFAGQQMLLSNSQEARLNTRQLMEKLRGLWQDDDPEAIKAIESGKIKLLLFNKQGKVEPNFELDVKKEELLEVLRNRIEKGVNNFFNALKLNFTKEFLADVDGIHIFLAGNSSKSKIVRELFKEYIDKKTAEIMDKGTTSGETSNFFHVYPPLGTAEAKQIQQEKGIVVEEDFTNPRPTGKTGVAYGLIEGRPGSRVKVVSEIKSSDEVKFKYYIGENRKKCFHVVLDREITYNMWYEFIDASEADFEFYYTSLPEATTNRLPITEDSIAKKICQTDVVDETANVYIRAVAPGTIEYVVAKPDEIKNNKFLGKAKKVTLD